MAILWGMAVSSRRVCQRRSGGAKGDLASQELRRAARDALCIPRGEKHRLLPRPALVGVPPEVIGEARRHEGRAANRPTPPARGRRETPPRPAGNACSPAPPPAGAASCGAAHRHESAPAPRRGSCRPPRWHPRHRRRPAPRHRHRWRGTPARAGTRGSPPWRGWQKAPRCLHRHLARRRVVAPLPLCQRLDQRHEHAQHALALGHPRLLHPAQGGRRRGVAGEDHQIAAGIEQPRHTRRGQVIDVIRVAHPVGRVRVVAEDRRAAGREGACSPRPRPSARQGRYRKSQPP